METSNVGNWVIGDNLDYVERFGTDGLKPCHSDTVALDETLQSSDKVDRTIEDTGTSDGLDVREVSSGTTDSVCVHKTDEIIDVNGERDGSKDIRDCYGRDVTGADEIQGVNMTTVAEEDNDNENRGVEKETDDTEKKLLVGDCGDSSQDREDDESDGNRLDNEPVKRQKIERLAGESNGSDMSAENSAGTVKVEDGVVTDSTSSGAGNSVELIETPDGNFSPKISTERRGLERKKMTVHRHCMVCRSQYADPLPKELIIYLHAVRYKVRTVYLLHT